LTVQLAPSLKKSKRKKKSFKYEDEYKLVQYEVCCIMHKWYTPLGVNDRPKFKIKLK